MLKAYKYRIYPSQKQQEQLVKAFGCVRFVYNLGLETKIAAWTSARKYINVFDLSNQIKELKDTEAPWLKDCPSQALQMSMRNLDNAYTNFFKRGAGFPKFKNKHGRQSFQLPQGISLLKDNSQIFIPKLKWVDIDMHRVFKGEIKTVTISRTVTNKYFISVLVDNQKELPNKKKIKESTAIGMDLGIKDFAITSDGKKFENQKFLSNSLKQLRIEQRSLARKQKGSNHYKKQKMVVALIHEKVRNQRQDYLHKISNKLVNTYDTIILEDLSVVNMINNHNLARAISDVGWSEFRQMLQYKSDWLGKNLIVIGRFEPSSKTCSSCGNINKELELSDRHWVCIGCKTKHDRDVNAAVNIKNFGLRNKPSISQRETIVCA